ncbi:hypothetical protein B0O80DRAFT_258814 [Mortierella sp. GBAus27b]|nr:hypothetical protein B0O80DRAFT_258814 [Mortierella sp. GBAus27b]
MEAIQSFRLAGTTDVLEIPCDQDDGHNVIYWHDILDAFPGVQYVKNGKTLIKKLRDTGPDGNKPQRIKHYPGVTLDVVVSSPCASDPAASTTAHSTLSGISVRAIDLSGACAEPIVGECVVEGLGITESNADKQIVKLGQRNTHQSAFEQRLVSFLPPDLQTQVIGSSDVHGWTVQAIQDGQMDKPHEQLIACLQVLKDEMTKNNELVSDVKELALKNNEMASKNNELAFKNNELVIDVKDLTLRNMELSTNMIKMQEEMKQLQIQALSQLALLQNSVQALVT